MKHVNPEKRKNIFGIAGLNFFSLFDKKKYIEERPFRAFSQ